VARRVAVGTGTLLLDSEGLWKAAARDERTAAYVKQALREQGRVVVPAVTLAEVLRGGPRDAPVHQALKQFEIVPVDTEIGRAAGEILGRAGGDKTVDAVVAAVAARQPGPVLLLTSDPGDLAALSQGLGDIRIRAV
jgi:predicted nucleic acid-binding protein